MSACPVSGSPASSHSRMVFNSAIGSLILFSFCRPASPRTPSPALPKYLWAGNDSTRSNLPAVASLC